MESIGMFNGTEIDYRFEYTEARKFMGLKSTDMDTLISSVGHLYLQCPEDMQPHFQALLEEITQRQTMLATISILGTRKTV
jgi:hypothetical protein